MGDISAPLQISLFWVFQDKTYESFGSIKSYKADVRIVNVTNKNFEDFVGSYLLAAF
jgi:transcriptional regulator with PAS, ATPase and Fis domain